MKIKGKTVRTSYFTRYCKSRLGYASKENVKLYDLVCMALEVDGMPMPMNMTSKQWVAENVDHIMGRNQYEKLKSCSSQRTNRPAKKKVFIKSSKQTSFVSTDAFLSTYEWRKLRMEALIKYGRKCMCCGATPATGAVMNVDHIKPRKFFPSLALDINNLQVLCHECNHGKGNWDQSDWR
jgi:5-methylcytosine-specific restriction endonuclease McrA